MCDVVDNVFVVCNMENFDFVGIYIGDFIVFVFV